MLSFIRKLLDLTLDYLFIITFLSYASIVLAVNFIITKLLLIIEKIKDKI